MKKLIIGFIGVLIFTVFYLVVTFDDREKFYLLNWGEYIDPLLIEEFEDLYNVSVQYDEVGSSEAMYTKVSSGTTPYDVAIPGDYIIEKMHKNNMLNELDYTKLTNFDLQNIHQDLLNIMSEDEFYKDVLDYTIPYFWGSYSILYRNTDESIITSVEENGFNVFFDNTLTPNNTKIGMYDVARWSASCYLLANDYDVNINDLSVIENDFISKVKSMNYTMWADDNLKKQIANGNLDIAFTQLGDFFDQHYVTTEDGKDVQFSAYVPENTAAFFDGMVIPKTSKNIDLAHEFINFFIEKETAYQNAMYVGYCPVLNDVIEMIEEDDEMSEFIENYPFYLNPTQNKNAVLFRDLGQSYDSYVISLINKAKN